MAAAKASIVGATRVYFACPSGAIKAVWQHGRMMKRSSSVRLASAGNDAGALRGVAIAKARVMIGKTFSTIAGLILRRVCAIANRGRVHAKLVSSC